MNFYQWIWASLVYLLIGQVFSLVYVLAYRSAMKTVWLGLMGIFWPACLAIDLLLTIGGGFGTYSRWMIGKFEKQDELKANTSE